MDNQEFLKNAVSNMDRDVEYEYSKQGLKKKGNHSNRVQGDNTANMNDGNNDKIEGRFN